MTSAGAPLPERSEWKPFLILAKFPSQDYRLDAGSDVLCEAKTRAFTSWPSSPIATRLVVELPSRNNKTVVRGFGGGDVAIEIPCTCTTRMVAYAEGGGAKNGIGTLGMEAGIGGSVTLGTAGIGGKVTLGTAGIGGNAAFGMLGTTGTAGIDGTVTAGTFGIAGMGGKVATGTPGTAGIGGKVAAGIDVTAPAAGIGGSATPGTVGTGGFGTVGMPGTAAGTAAGVVSARWRAAWQVLLIVSISAMTTAVAERAEAAAMADLDAFTGY
ncbi:hypothetical protein EJB05_14627, partial [Eragrostis curvula]